MASILELSLISITDKCYILPSFKSNEDNSTPEKRYNPIEYPDISFEDAELALSMYAKCRNSTITHPNFPYRIQTINPPFITLKRIHKSNCPICHRVHEHENPYLTILGLEDRRVYFNCRRSKDVIYAGKLDQGLNQQNLDESISDWLDQAIGSELSTDKSFEPNDIDKLSNISSKLDNNDSFIEDKRIRRSFLRDALDKKKHKHSQIRIK